MPRAPRTFLFLAVLLLSSAAVRAEDKPEQKRPTTLAEAEALLRAKKITMDFSDAPFFVVVDFLREQAGLNIIVDPQVLEEFANEGKSVNLRLDDVCMLDALKILLSFWNLDRVFKNGVVFITSPEGARGEYVQRVYDVSRLTQMKPDSPGRVRDLFAACLGEEGQEVGEPFFDEVQDIYMDDLVTLIQESVETDSWDSEGAVIQVLDQALVITNSESAHQKIAALIAELEADFLTELTLRLKVVPVKAGSVPGLPGDHLTDEALEACLRAVAAEGSVMDVVTVAGNGRRTHVFSGNQQFFTVAKTAGDPKQFAVAAGVLADVQVFWPEGPEALCVLRFSGTGDITSAPGTSFMPFLQGLTCVENRVGFWTLAACGPAPLSPQGECTAVFLRIDPVASGQDRARMAPQESPEDKAVRQALETKRLSLNFMDVPLRDALQEVSSRTGVNVVISPAVFEEKSEEELLVFLTVEDLRVLDALKLLLTLKDLDFAVRDGVVKVLTADEGGVVNCLKRRFPVSDLLGGRQHLPGGLRKFFDGDFQPPAAIVEEEEPLSGDSLMMMIRDSISPESWDTPPFYLSYRSMILYTVNRAETLEAIDRFLSELRGKIARPVQVRGCLLDALPEIIKTAEGHAVLDRAQAAQLDAKLKSGEIPFRGAFSCRGLLNRTFSLGAGGQRTYPKPGGSPEDYEARAFLDGMTVDMLVTSTSSKDNLSLEFGAYFASFAAREDPFASDPAAASLWFRTRVTIPAGGAALIGGGAPGGARGYLYVKVE